MRSPDLKFREMIFGKRNKWQKVKIQIYALTDEEINDTMWELTDMIFDHTRAAMYFARYTVSGSPIIIVNINVELRWTHRQYVSFFKKHKKRCKVISVEDAGGSDPHAFAYLMARSLRDVPDQMKKDATHWMFNMTGMGYAAEVKLHCEMGAGLAGNLMLLDDAREAVVTQDVTEMVKRDPSLTKFTHAKR